MTNRLTAHPSLSKPWQFSGRLSAVDRRVRFSFNYCARRDLPLTLGERFTVELNVLELLQKVY